MQGFLSILPVTKLLHSSFTIVRVSLSNMSKYYKNIMASIDISLIDSKRTHPIQKTRNTIEGANHYSQTQYYLLSRQRSVSLFDIHSTLHQLLPENTNLQLLSQIQATKQNVP